MSKRCPWHYLLETPLGPMGVMLDPVGRLTRLTFLERHLVCLDDIGTDLAFPILGFLQRQLESYFQGACRTFNLPMNLEGSPFQLRVWHEVRAIPYGRTWSFREVAKALGDERLTMAVGQALLQNPIAILVPCHRVLPSDGGLGNYLGGQDRKQALLALEHCEVPTRPLREMVP